MASKKKHGLRSKRSSRRNDDMRNYGIFRMGTVLSRKDTAKRSFRNQSKGA